jgi:hypothetical protein
VAISAKAAYSLHIFRWLKPTAMSFRQSNFPESCLKSL